MTLNTPKDIPIGTILSDSWNGMSDFFEVIKTTDKSVTVRKIKWETCAPDAGMTADGDPTYRAARIKLDENGNTVPEVDWTGKEKVYRKLVKPARNGGFYIPSIAWNGGSVAIVADKNKKFSFYWG